MNYITDYFDETKMPDEALFQELVHFYELNFPFAWNLSSWQNFCHTRKFHLYIYRYDGQLQASALFEEINDGEVGHLHKIAVDQSARKQKIGYNFMMACVRDLLEHGLSGIYLEVATKNEAAIKLYEKCGIEVQRRVKNFYSNGDDAYIMYNY